MIKEISFTGTQPLGMDKSNPLYIVGLDKSNPLYIVGLDKSNPHLWALACYDLASFPGHLKIRPGVHCSRMCCESQENNQFTSLDIHGFPGFMGMCMCEQVYQAVFQERG